MAAGGSNAAKGALNGIIVEIDFTGTFSPPKHVSKLSICPSLNVCTIGDVSFSMDDERDVTLK